MTITRLLALTSTAFLLAGCFLEDNIERLIDGALGSPGEATVTESCTSFLGLGPAVATFEISTELAGEAAGLTGRFSENSAWSRHESMLDFVSERARQPGGIQHTLIDGKDCLDTLTPDAVAILLERMPRAYYASPHEDVVVVLSSERHGRGIIFVQAP